MKKIHIMTKINSGIDDDTYTDTYGEYNEEDNIIKYVDKSIDVCVIIGEKIIFERKSNDYNIKLIFEDGKVHNSVYEILNPKMTLDLKVQTKLLKREYNGFHIEYKLDLGKENTGNFSIDFNWEE
jgi:uncharacterized beta-barrel protein YwiB (DUF1934 family)